ncbi:MAG: DUF3592 domain-containing protein [Pirellulaceae bacterium]
MLQQLNKATELGGFAAGAIKRQLLKHSVTQQEIDTFRQSNIPRRIPSGLMRQMAGDTFPLIPIGIVFVVAGLILGTVLLLPGDQHDPAMAALFMSAFVTIGSLMAGITYWFRNNKSRILSRGKMETGVITEVKRTDTRVNNQQLHRVTVVYPNGAGSSNQMTAKCNAYSMGANNAYRLQASATPIQILVDPANPQKIICLDLVTVFEG